MAKKLKIEINNPEKLKDLLQETYDLADTQIIQAQSEINKLANSTKLQEEVMQSKKDYAKAINDYLTIKDKAISKKIEIAKIMSDICKANTEKGNGTTEDTQLLSSFNFDNIREMLDNETASKTETIKLKK